VRYLITHRTTYQGEQRVSVGHNEAWLRPRDLPRQQCEQHDLQISPAPSILSTRTDYFGNTVSVFSFNQGYDTLEVTATSTVALAGRPARDVNDSPPWEAVRNAVRGHDTPAEFEALEYVFDSPRVGLGEHLAHYARISFTPDRPILSALADLTRRIHADFKYDTQATTVLTPIDEVFETRRGVCQDFAHLQLGMLRSLGVPARYVSGYLRTYPPPGKPRLVGADASHAWLSVYGGELGWVDADPTNNIFPGTDHITVAWGRDFSDVSPVKGVYLGGGSHTLRVSVDVAVLNESG
jgi:transglutaminase-like putative cysteine protease